MPTEITILVSVVFFLIILPLMLIALYLSGIEWSITLVLKQSGVFAEGKIVNQRADFIGRTARYYITYSFNRGITREQQVSQKYFDSKSKDSLVSIRYLPNNPKISRLSGKDSDNTIRNNMTIISIIIILLLPPLAVAWIAFLSFGLFKNR